MLMKPPSIFDDVVSQDSQNITAKSRQQSTKGKNSRKQTTIRIGGNSNQHRDRSFQHDNESVHSTGSRKSKGKQAKQSTLGRIKINEGYNHKEEDNQSVHSTGSRNSHKSGKKQSNIMQRPKIQQPLAKPKNEYERHQIRNTNKQPSFKQIFDAPQESLIKVYQQQSPEPLRYYNDNQQQRVKANEKGKKFAPFAEIQQKYIEEQVPIVRIQQPKNAKKNNVVSVSKPQQNKFKNAIQRIQITQSKQYTSIEQSQTQFDNSKMANTKSMRRPIFSREDNNASKVSNMIEQSNVIDQSNVSGLQSTSRRKSNSRLRQIFNKSKEKNSIEQSCLPNQSKTSSFGDLQSQSRAIKPAVGSYDQMVQPQRKVINDDEDNFGVDSIKSGLDLTVSNHQVQKDRDSLIFEFQPEKKKGMTVTSKNKKITQSHEQMIKLKDNLISIKNNHAIPASKNEDLPQIKTNNMVSKDLTQINKLLKNNEEYLKNSGLLNLSDSDKTKSNRKSNEYLFNFEEEEEKQSPWKNIDNRKQQPLNIKRVQRNQRSSKDKNEDLSFKNALKEPILQNKIQKEPPFKKKAVEEKEKVVLVIKKQSTSKAQQITQNYGRIQRNKQIKNDTLNIQPVWKNQTQQRNQKKQQPIKSPGKILRNYEQSPNSRDEHDNKSQKSNKSGKKGKSIKQSAIPRDRKMKIQIKIDGPRAQQSFYQESIQQLPDKKQQLSINDLSLYSKKVEPAEQKKPNVYHFSDDDNEIDYKPKSRTDINFYDNEIRSNKPPSSRPPLSGKSAKSKSTSKDKVPKQSTLNIKGSNNQQKPQVKVQKTGGKKLTLMERALMKHNQSEEDSQGSFSSREDNFSQNSRNTSNSKGSKKSVKQSSININKKESLIKNNNVPKPPIQRRNSSNSSSHQEQQIQKFHQTNPQRLKEVPQRPIVSKNCTFIDDKGRLVQKDLVIKGSDIYGQPRLEDSSLQAMQRMKRAKENRRSRSRSRENKNQISRKKSKEDIQSSSYDNSSYCSSFYENNTYNKGGRGNNPNNSLYSNREPYSNQTALKQFMKPVQQVPIYNQSAYPSKKQSNYYQQDDQPPRTLNDMFRKNGNNNYQNSGVSNISQSRSRRSLKRTQKSASKKF